MFCWCFDLYHRFSLSLFPFSCCLFRYLVAFYSLFASTFPSFFSRLYVRFVFILNIREGKTILKFLFYAVAFTLNFVFRFSFSVRLLISLFLLCYSFALSWFFGAVTFNFQHTIIKYLEVASFRQLLVVYIRLSLVDLVRSFGDLKRKLNKNQQKNTCLCSKALAYQSEIQRLTGLIIEFIELYESDLVFAHCTWHNILFQFCEIQNAKQ